MQPNESTPTTINIAEDIEQPQENVSIDNNLEQIDSTDILDESEPTETTDTTDAYVAEQPILEPPALVIEQKLSRSQWLQIYLIAALFCNVYFLFFDGHFDIGFWKNWVTELATTGFANYHGDYPPLWSDWLYVVSRFYTHLHIPIENNILFKYVTQIPVTAYHLLLIYVIYKIADQYAKSEAHFHAALILTAFNPAILFNGPIWGQIDVTPLIPLIAAIWAGTSKRYQVLMVPLYAVAMLTKFQMIAFAPVLGILFFRNIKQHLIGILLSIPTFLLAFLPAIIAHNFVQAFSLPYIGSMNMFSSATMGAANVWIPVTGNLAADNIVLFGITPDSKFASLFTVRRVGMIAFSLVCLFVFIAGMRKLAKNKFQQNQDVLASDMFFYAVLCATTFFTLLPGMHERYLMPAAIVALAYFATSPGKLIYPLSLGLISALNHTMSHGIKTSSIWPSLSWIMIAIFIYAILEFLLGQKWTKFCKSVIHKITSFSGLGILVFLLTTSIITHQLYTKNRANDISLEANQLSLTRFSPTFAKQDYGVLQVNQNVVGTPLAVGGKRYTTGFGTHSNSTANFAMPINVKSFSFIASLDDDVENADVVFMVWGDGKLLWKSPVINRPLKNAEITTLSIEGVKELSLQVDGLGNISSDHADWINPILTLENAPK